MAQKKQNTLVFALGAGLVSYLLFSSFAGGTGGGGTLPGGGGTGGGGTLPGGGGTGGGSLPGGGGLPTSGNITISTQLKSSNLDTKKYAQNQLNSVFQYFRDNGGKPEMWWSSSASLPQNLVVDGNIGSATKEAIKYLYAWSYNLTNPNLPKQNPTQITWDVSTVTLDNLHNIIVHIFSFY